MSKFVRIVFVGLVVIFCAYSLNVKSSNAATSDTCRCYTLDPAKLNLATIKYSEITTSSEEKCKTACANTKADPPIVMYIYGDAPDTTALNMKPVSDQVKNTSAEPMPVIKKFNYTLLESFPGFFKAGQTMTDLPTMILSIYKFGIWTVGIAGLFMLVVGGFMYMTSAGNTSTAGNARGIIWDSLLGIVAALGAYLILYVINPDLTKINLSFTAVSVSEPEPMPSGGAVLAEGRLSDAVARQNLSAAGITVNKDNCPNSQATNCTSLDGIPAISIGNLIALQNACRQYNSSCKMMVTGGTEAGHKSHGPGNPMIDIRQDAITTSFLREVKVKKQYANYGIGQVCTVSNGDLSNISYNHDYNKTCQDPSSTTHFHFSFSG